MKMRGAVLYESGRPKPYHQSTPLVIETLDLDGPKQNEVLVEIRAAGLCHSDLSTIEGIRTRPLPAVLGHEAAGIVREVGPGVTALKDADQLLLRRSYRVNPSPSQHKGHFLKLSSGKSAVNRRVRRTTASLTVESRSTVPSCGAAGGDVSSGSSRA